MSKPPQRKILIVDDNEDLQILFRYAFEADGYEVKISGNGLLGINDTISYKPDIVLLDIMMPEMNGFEYLEAIKRNTSVKVPIIVISNLTQDSEKQRALDSGADMYLIKSDYEGPDLVAKVNSFLAEYKPQA